MDAIALEVRRLKQFRDSAAQLLDDHGAAHEALRARAEPLLDRLDAILPALEQLVAQSRRKAK
jgi:hypothetical protein